jgi:acetyl esterase/lipase
MPTPRAVRRLLCLAVLGPALGAAPAAATTSSGCAAQAYTGSVPAATDPVDTTSLGPSAPAAYEIGAPLGFPYAEEPVARVMILIHGGGWETVGRTAMETLRTESTAWREAGWETVNIDYHACARSLPDVVKFYDLIRARVGSAVPICIEGQSAGAQLALMIAALRSSVACVIAEGAPTDLRDIAAQGKLDAGSDGAPASLATGSAAVAAVAKAAFGARLATDSPVAHASTIDARVLLARAADDPYIPAAQESELLARLRTDHPGTVISSITLAAGTVDWIHAAVSTAAQAAFELERAALVSPFGHAPITLPQLPPLPFSRFGFGAI